MAEQVEQFKSVSEEFGAGDFQWATVAEERNRLWQARHNAYYAGKALRQGAQGLVTDCCVPISALAACIRRAQALVESSGFIAPLVGHVGDGNFHLLILIDPDNDDELSRARRLAGQINRVALEYGGTVTGEHGVGTGKRQYMTEEHGDGYLLMGQLKKALDPHNLMNPGKLVSVN